jgi:peptidase M1-like protein
MRVVAPLTGLLAMALATTATAQVRVQASGAARRAIRTTIPITRSFERGLAAGTRDSSGHPGARYWQLRTDYTIEARLDPATGRLTGHERVTITNGSDSTLRAIVLHLDQNRFAPNVARSEPVVALTSGLAITKLIANGDPVDLTSPNVQRWKTETVGAVPLKTPIPPKGTGTLEAEWNFDVPLVPENERGDRMGRWGTRLYQIAQWYPKVAVYDDLHGWNADPYLGSAEFFNNFGSFDVRLDLPAGWLIGATGVLTNADSVLAAPVRQRLAQATASDSQISIVDTAGRGAGKATLDGERLSWHFRADSVGDFAWAASNEFVWDRTRATIPGRGVIPIDILYLPEHSRYRQTGEYARHALQYYSGLWMPYAFPHFTQVDGPEGGMEYPSLTMSGPGFGVTDHEIGHQWWPMMVGVNETWYGWMDEGFNQYMNILSGAVFRDSVPRLDGIGQQYGRISGNESEPPMMWNANWGGPLYSFTTYGKAPMMLSALGGIVGDSAVQRAMSVYAHDWRFKHPSPWDFMFTMNRELHRDLGWFWYYWLFTTESVDESISAVNTTAGRTTVVVRQAGEMPAPIVLKVEFAGGSTPIKPMRGAVIEGNTATVTWPVDVWAGGGRTYDAMLDLGARKIEKITLDPGGRFPDRNPLDNVWPRNMAAAPSVR